jgi:hypothetical protein
LGGGDNFFFVGEVVVLLIICAEALIQDQKMDPVFVRKGGPSFVMAALVAAIPIRNALRLPSEMAGTPGRLRPSLTGYARP